MGEAVAMVREDIQSEGAESERYMESSWLKQQDLFAEVM